MTQTDPRRRILDEFGAGDEIAGIDTDYTLSDLRVFIPAVALAFVCLLAGVSAGTLLAIITGTASALVILAVTTVLVIVTPSHLTPQVWLQQIASFKRQPKIRTIVGSSQSERTETLTQISRFDPDEDALVRNDGTLVGGIHVEPANMALATAQEWHAAADALGDALNALDFAIQIRSTARRVDTADLVKSYEQRLDDSDVQTNETLRDLIDVYRRRFPQEFSARGTSVREYQILIPVRIHEVQLAERGTLGELESVPYLGTFLGLVGAESTRLSDEELALAQRTLLGERRQAIEDAIRGLESCTAESVSAETLASWVEESWTGRRTRYTPENEHERLRTHLVVSTEHPDERLS